MKSDILSLRFISSRNQTSLAWYTFIAHGNCEWQLRVKHAKNVDSSLRPHLVTGLLGAVQALHDSAVAMVIPTFQTLRGTVLT